MNQLQDLLAQLVAIDRRKHEVGCSEQMLPIILVNRCSPFCQLLHQSLRDPRNWVRPVVAVAAGTVAGGALALLNTRRRRHRPTGLRAAAEDVLRAVRPGD